MSDDPKPGYDFFPAPRPTGYADPRSSSYSHPANGPYPNLSGAVVPRQTQWADRIPPVQRSGAQRWAIILVALVLVVFVVPGILAAVAIPVFLSQRMKAEFQSTTVQLPAQFNGHKRNTGAKAAAVAKTFAVGDIAEEDIAVYGSIGPKTVIILAIKPPAAMSQPQQEIERNDIEQAFAAQGTPLFLIRETDPGELGGWIGCGSTTGGLEICLATSVGSLVTVISGTKTTADPVQLLRQARAATVTRS